MIFTLLLLAMTRMTEAVAAPPPPDQGCWVSAFGREEYRPPVTTFTGPSFELIAVPGARSLMVGPGARLVGYAGNALEIPSLVLGAGTRIPDLDATDFHRRVESFDVVCHGVEDRFGRVQ